MILIKEKQFKANLHSHSVLSDGHLTPEELKEIYKQHGYSILAITDHERPHDHSALSDDSFLMLTGYEAYIRPGTECRYDYYQPELHLNLFNRDPHNTDLICFNDNYVKYVKDPDEKASMPRFGSTQPRNYTPEYINQFIETAKQDGYIVALNHPVWSLEDYSELFKYKGLFSMEMCNYGSFRDGIYDYNAALYDMFLRRGIRIFTHSADDNHNPCAPDIPQSDSFGGFTMINTDDDCLSYSSVFAALENGSFYSSMGPEIKRLEINGDKAYIETSPAQRITMLVGGKKTYSVFAPSFDESVTCGEFTIPKECKFVRFSVRDSHGLMADTRGYFKEELQ